MDNVGKTFVRGGKLGTLSTAAGWGTPSSCHASRLYTQRRRLMMKKKIVASLAAMMAVGEPRLSAAGTPHQHCALRLINQPTNRRFSICQGDGWPISRHEDKVGLTSESHQSWPARINPGLC